MEHILAPLLTRLFVVAGYNISTNNSRWWENFDSDNAVISAMNSNTFRVSTFNSIVPRAVGGALSTLRYYLPFGMVNTLLDNLSTIEEFTFVIGFSSGRLNTYIGLIIDVTGENCQQM